MILKSAINYESVENTDQENQLQRITCTLSDDIPVLKYAVKIKKINYIT